MTAVLIFKAVGVTVLKVRRWSPRREGDQEARRWGLILPDSGSENLGGAGPSFLHNQKWYPGSTPR